MRAVYKKTDDPENKFWMDVIAEKFEGHEVRLGGIKSRRKVYEENADKGARFLQVCVCIV